MKISSEVFDDIARQVSDFEKLNLGIKYGLDFSEFAKVLTESKFFLERVEVVTLMGMMATLLLPKGKHDREAMEKVLQDSPIKSVVAELLYLGYKLGRKDAEIEQLEDMHRGL